MRIQRTGDSETGDREQDTKNRDGRLGLGTQDGRQSTIQRLERGDKGLKTGTKKGTEKWMIGGREENLKNDRGESSFKLC